MKTFASRLGILSVVILLAGVYVPASSMVPPFPAVANKVRIDPRTISEANRTECPESIRPRPPNRVNTTARVQALRDLMTEENLDAYITLISDSHGTAGSDYDQRVTYISGFSGSNGFTIVTRNHAALWTDGRYFLQAEQQMECTWILMKISTLGYPTGQEWLADVLQDNSRVGAYANYVSIDTWKSYQDAFDSKGIKMINVTRDLVDIIWSNDTGTNRPQQPKNPLIVHELEFTGSTTQEKLDRVREKLTENQADCLVITVLEESAWLFNLRGTDRTASLFYGYAIVYSHAKNRPSQLFIHNVTRALGDADLRSHLNLNPDGSCVSNVLPRNCIELKEYTEVEEFIRDSMTDINTVWLDPTSSFAIYDAIGEGRVKSPMKQSPIALMKAIKNDVERRNFYECIKRDSAAVVEFMASLEPQVKSGGHFTEMSAARILQGVRSTYKNFKGLSFDTISAVGPNAAVIHYRPSTEKDDTITTDKIYLLDSGGQYLDGTTDVTRTFHFGTPTDIEKEAYTRVLMGAIDLAQTVWPFGYYGSDIDSRARTPLWQHGWDYNHGTGHGIGYFLSVHEGPGRINIGYNPAHAPLYEGMFFSDEPGYYEDGQFGIRLETLVGIEKANTPHNFGGKQYLGFKPATLVPFEPNLIKYELLSHSQIKWLNEYHARCEKEVGDYLHDVRNNHTAYAWLAERTKPIPTSVTGLATPLTPSLATTYTLLLVLATTLLGAN